MALKVPFASTIRLLNSLIAANLNGAILHSYSNNHVPADGDVVGSYVENTYPGYASIVLNTWSAAALDASNKASTEVVSQIWTAGAIVAPENIYGIYVTDSLGNLLWAELNPAGVISMAVLGQTFAYLPRFTLRSEF